MFMQFLIADFMRINVLQNPRGNAKCKVEKTTV